jgi:hypothetical protein
VRHVDGNDDASTTGDQTRSCIKRSIRGLGAIESDHYHQQFFEPRFRLPFDSRFNPLLRTLSWHDVLFQIRLVETMSATLFTVYRDCI